MNRLADLPNHDLVQYGTRYVTWYYIRNGRVFGRQIAISRWEELSRE